MINPPVKKNVKRKPYDAKWRNDFFAEHRTQHEKIPTWEGIRGQRYVYARYDGQSPPYEFLHDLEVDPDQLDNFFADPSYKGVLDRMRIRCDTLRDEFIRAREVAIR